MQRLSLYQLNIEYYDNLYLVKYRNYTDCRNVLFIIQDTNDTKKTPNNFEILHTFSKIIYIWYLQIYYISNVVAGRLEIKH